MYLIKERLFRQWHTFGLFFKKNIDFVICLYILIPGIAFIYYLLRETVFKLDYGVLAEWNISIVIFLLLFGSSLLKSRLFIEEADQIVLIQHKEYAQLKRLAYWYSFFFNLLLMVIIYSLFCPLFYVVKDFTIIKMIVLGLCMLCSYLICDVLDLWQYNWLRPLCKLIIMILLTFAVLYANLWLLLLIVLIAITTILFFEYFMIHRHHFFHQQLELDINRAQRFLSFLFQANKDIRSTKINYFKRKSPKLFTKIYCKSKEKTLIELILKTIWRNKNYLSLLLRLVLICIPLLIFLPIWMNVILLIVIYFGISTFVNSISYEIKDTPIFKLIRYSDDDWHSAIHQTSKYIVTPVIILHLAIVIIKLFTVS